MADIQDQPSLWQKIEAVRSDSAVNAVLHDLAHDLATPITIVGLNLELLKEHLLKETTESARTTELIARVEDGHQKLQKLLKDLQGVLTQ